MNKFRSDFDNALGNFIGRVTGEDVLEILAYKEITYTGGYCESCWYTELRVEILYKTESSPTEKFVYHGNMVEFIKELLGENDE